MTQDAKRPYSPVGYVPEHVVAFVGADQSATTVAADNPLPIRATVAAAGTTPLTGTAAANMVAGPYLPVLGRPIVLTLSGSWSGSAQLLRSVDGGATRLPITVGGQPWASYTANCNEAVTSESEAGAGYWLAITIASGTLSYRIAQ